MADSFVDSIGVNTHLNEAAPSPYANASLMQAKLSKLGVRHVRDGCTLSFVGTIYTQMAAYASATPLKYNLIADQRFFSVTPANLSTIVSAIGINSLEAFEGDNEPDLNLGANWAQQATAYQQQLYVAVKGHTNPAIAALPVFSFAVGQLFQEGIAGDQTTQCDYVSLHSYTGNSIPGSAISNYISSGKAMSPTKPFVSTETGFESTTSDPTTQGKYVPRLYLEQWNAGIFRTYMYDFADGNDGAHWGLLNFDGTEKPAFTFMANMNSILSDPGSAFNTSPLSYFLSGNLTNVHNTLLQKRNGRYYLILWQEVASYNFSSKLEIVNAPVLVTLNRLQGFTSANVYDPSVSVSPQSSPNPSSGSLTLSVTDSPIILELIP